MKDKKLMQAAETAKERGYEYIHTIIKYEGKEKHYD